MARLRMLEEFEQRMASITEVERAIAENALETIKPGEIVLGEISAEMKLAFCVLEQIRLAGTTLHQEFVAMHQEGVEHNDDRCEELKAALGEQEIWVDFGQELLYGEWRLFGAANGEGFKHQTIGVRQGWKMVWRQREELEREALRDPGNLGGAIKAAIERAVGGRVEYMGEAPMDTMSAESLARMLREKAATQGDNIMTITPPVGKLPD